jgi:uncharacterized membrane protein YbhN (UPF0104 family)
MKRSSIRTKTSIAESATNQGISWSTVLNTIILLLAFFVLLPQLDQFSTSLDALQSANIGLVALAFGLGMSTLVFAALTYRLLAGSRLQYFRTLSVQIAGTFTNRLLPAGLGGMGINIRYLSKSKFPAGQAVSLAATNNILGFVGHTILLFVLIVLSDTALGEVITFTIPTKSILIAGAVLLIVLFILWSMKGWRRRIQAVLIDGIHHVLDFRKRPQVLLLATLSSLIVTLLYGACFYVCIRAIGLELTPVQTFIVFSFGVAAGSVTPTPGGLIGVEAGMLAGLISFGLPQASSLSAVLLYRLVTYWLPIIPGFVVFKILQARKII